MDFADRLLFAATRSRRLALRHGVHALAARTRRARTCSPVPCFLAPDFAHHLETSP